MHSTPEDSARPGHATEMVEPDRPHLELIDPARFEVWQSLEPVTRAEYDAMKVDPELRLVGIGTGTMDEHWFDRSPGEAQDGAMIERVIDGRRFGLCAKPDLAAAEQPFGADGPRLLSVDKHHGMRFGAGRRIPVVRSAQGEFFVQVVAPLPDTPAIAIPSDWQLGEVALERDWVLRLPAPTKAYFFSNLESYQGPVAALPGEWRVRA